jgi:hypothetical protein
MAKKKGLNAYRRAITPQVTSAARLRRYDRSRDLLIRFNETHLKKFCFQDEKDFSLQIATNRKNNVVWSSKKKTEIAPERLFHERNKQSKKVMVSAAISWNGVTEPFFVSDTDTNIKLNGPRYLEHLRGELMPAISRMQTTNKKYIFLQDSAPSHRSKQVQAFLSETLNDRFVKSTEWPPNSPDLNPLDYFFWDHVSKRVYAGQH